MSATLTKIAKQAGVSLTLVSHVLNGKTKQYRVSPETAGKVMRIAQELDYIKPVERMNAKFHEVQQRQYGLFLEWMMDSSYLSILPRERGGDLFDMDQKQWVSKEQVIKQYLQWLKDKS